MENKENCVLYCKIFKIKKHLKEVMLKNKTGYMGLGLV